MTHRDRFHAVMRFEPVDRLPCIEWAGWWNQTLDRWYAEGLPKRLVHPWDIRGYFGLDDYRQLTFRPRDGSCPAPAHHGAGLLTNEAEYEALLPHLYPSPEAMDAAYLRECAQAQARGERVLWLTLEGFFWFPRTLLGIECHLYAFYEQPDLMHRMNADLLAHSKRVFDHVCRFFTPDFMTFAEDMSYNGGPMIGLPQFDEYLRPYYEDLIPHMRERGTWVIVDTDGEISQAIPWYRSAGAHGFLPLERQAGCDLAAMRRAGPHTCFIGAFDKMVMNQGIEAVRDEFERLLPVMRQGGYIPSCDHQTPPGVSLEQYRQYAALQKEYAQKAAH